VTYSIVFSCLFLRLSLDSSRHSTLELFVFGLQTTQIRGHGHAVDTLLVRIVSRSIAFTLLEKHGMCKIKQRMFLSNVVVFEKREDICGVWETVSLQIKKGAENVFLVYFSVFLDP